jgi:hypothetical protein
MSIHLLSTGIIPRREGEREKPADPAAGGGEGVRLREWRAALWRFGDEHYVECIALNLVIIAVGIVCTAINVRVLIGR